MNVSVYVSLYHECHHDRPIGRFHFITFLYVKMLRHLLQNTDKTIQKKSYRILEEICSSSSAACKSLVTSKLSDLQSHLTSSLSSSAPSARAPRLRCLAHILDILDHGEESVAFLQALVPEAILCTKEVAQKARQAAFALLTKTGML